uniref:Regulator of G protein signaling 2 n=1 Tax=Lates calcarifer TaxID=8187 RepID=A0A4W6FQ08_LATCA
NSGSPGHKENVSPICLVCNQYKTNITVGYLYNEVMFSCVTDGQKAFRDFMKSEYCEENLDFWFACQEFKTFDSQEELTRRAARIYEEFISAESPRQVNLDFYTRELISQSLQQPSPSCFVAAQKKIYSLMENDSFPRFIQSEQYKVLFDLYRLCVIMRKKR